MLFKCKQLNYFLIAIFFMSCENNVNIVEITNLELNEFYIDLYTEGTDTLLLIITPENATNKNIVWTSEDTYTATVSSEGVVKANNPGVTTITARVDTMTAECVVRVKRPATLSIKHDDITSADYIGRDLNLIIEFDKPTIFDTSQAFTFHCLNAKIYPTEEIINKSEVSSIVVPIYWESYDNLLIDSKNNYSDSIFLSFNDGQKYGESNVVHINVLNLPPVITNFTVAESSYVVQNYIREVYRCSYHLKNKNDSVLPITVSAIDPDNNYSITWAVETNDSLINGDMLLSWNSTSNTANYYIRKNSTICDYVRMMINDNNTLQIVELNILKP